MIAPRGSSRACRAGASRLLACVLVALSVPGAIGDAQPTEPARDARADTLPECVLILRDGRRISGVLVEETDEGVVVRIHGIDTPFDRSVLAKVELLKPLRDRYRSMRAAIGDEDVDRLVLLIDWLVQHDLIEEAMVEVEHVLSVDPRHPDAIERERIVRSQLELKSRDPGRERAPRNAPEPREVFEFPLLSEEQVNLIKVYEVDLNNPPRLVIDRKTVERLIDEYRNDEQMPRTQEGREALFRKRPIEILELMFRMKARPLYDEVTVIGHPSSMQIFRDRVHRTWLLNSCATARCHGGAEAGRLMLNGRRANSDESLYTNFLILDRFRLQDGTALINYAEPGESPLLQMALPEEISRRPHPEVPVRGRVGRYRPVFRSERDSRFQEAVEWIRSMYQPRPEYPIDYEPPAPSEPIQPAERGPRVPR